MCICSDMFCLQGDNSQHNVTCSHSSSVVSEKSERPGQVCQPYP